MADRIVLTGLEAFGYHGVFAEEKRHGQRFLVDVTLELELDEAIATDHLSATVNYAAVAQACVDILTGPSYDLIEAVAGRIVEAVFGVDERITSVEVTLHKPDAPIPHTFADVAVVLTRTRAQLGTVAQRQSDTTDNATTPSES